MRPPAHPDEDRRLSALNRIVINARFAPVTASSKQASALAMVVNELAANALKHSFAKANGTVAFSGETRADGAYRLTCADNGCGSANPDPNRRSGLGLSIIRAAVAQLGGEIETESSEFGYRTVITMRF